jgi:hypothetical protein
VLIDRDTPEFLRALEATLMETLSATETANFLKVVAA